jgi:hypothetical protein
MAKLVTVNELVEVLEQCRNGSFASVNMLTEVKTKKNCPFANLRKRNRVTVQIGTNYESIVQRRTDSPDFKAEAIWGGKGEHVNRYLVRHTETGELYLKFSGVNLQACSPEYLVGNTVIDSEQVKPYLYAKSSNVANWFMPKVSSVKSITIGGEDYIITT